MANKERYTKEYILEMGLKFVEEYGIESLNARNFAKYMNVSTQPIFRNYTNMNDLKEDIFLKANNIWSLSTLTCCLTFFAGT